MDLLRILDRKRQQLEETEARVAVLRDDVATLERALEIAEREEVGGEAVASSAAPEAVAPTEAKPRAAIKLIDVIRGICARLPEPISTARVRERLQQDAPDLFEVTHYSSISGTMRRMAIRGELVPVEKGGPGKEATYRRPKPGELVEPHPEDGVDETETL